MGSFRLFRTAKLVLLVMVGACATPLPTVQRTPSQAPADTAGTLLGRVLAPHVAAHPGASGFLVLDEPRDAFAARVLLAGANLRVLRKLVRAGIVAREGATNYFGDLAGALAWLQREAG